MSRDLDKSFTKIDKLILGLYFINLIMSPFYFFQSGLPQVSDFIMVLVFVLHILNSKLSIMFDTTNKNLLKAGLTFVTYISFVNVFWAFRLHTLNGFIKPTIFYIFNFLILVITISLYSKYKEVLLNVITYGLISSISIQFIVFLLAGGYSGGRSTGAFNNPNQLGYYTLLVTALLLLLSRKIKINTKLLLIALGFSLVLNLTSLSKAAIISMVLLLLSYILVNIRKSKLAIVLVVSIIAIGFLFQNTSYLRNNRLVYAVDARLNQIGLDNDDSLDARGYYRIIEYPQYWIFGAGEGEYTRFGYPIEFHSTLGNIQVSYGLIGIVLFLNILLKAFGIDKNRSWYILFALLLYGLTHNGIRDSFFWIVIALIATNKKRISYE